jgi:NifB/MoaA-like Fe-S oxidoreductase
VDLKQEFDNLAEKLKQQRDELNVRMHLAGMEVKEEWEHSEQQWNQFRERLTEIRDETKDVTEEFAAATIVIGEELGNAYKRIVERLKD